MTMRPTSELATLRGRSKGLRPVRPCALLLALASVASVAALSGCGYKEDHERLEHRRLVLFRECLDLASSLPARAAEGPGAVDACLHASVTLIK